jgi:hypothetical protein
MRVCCDIDVGNAKCFYPLKAGFIPSRSTENEMRVALRIRMVRFIGLMLCVGLASSVSGQDNSAIKKRFTNEDVISMVGLGITEDVIIAKIRAMSAAGADAISFDTGIEGLKGLKAAAVPDSVIKVMINPVGAPATIITTAATPMTLDPNLPPPEVGVYWKDRANFILLQGQALTNTKAGGKAGSLFTNGMRNQHWDATLAGPTSKNVVRERHPAFYLYVPDGSDAADYVLIKLNKKSDHREFQVGSFGGITGGKSGVKKDKELGFKADHVGIRMYKVTLESDLKPGEYAFFMGTGQGATMSGARGGNRSGGNAAGRIYDFSIME